MTKINSQGQTDTSIPVQTVKPKKKRKIGRTGRRRVRNKKAQQSLMTEAPHSETWHQKKSVRKIEIVPSPTSQTADTVNQWLGTQLHGNPELPPKKIPQSLAEASAKQIKKALPELEATPEPDFQHSKQYSQYMDKLDELKSELGGAPNYAGKRPKLKPSKLFLGLSVEMVKIWINKAVKSNWFPAPLWGAIASYFNIGKGLSHYEYLSMALQSLDRMKHHCDEIQSRLLSGRDPCIFFNKVTGLTFHPTLNSPRMLATSVQEYINAFEHHMERAIEEGRLKDFFVQAMPDSDVCFETRMKSMIEFSAENPIEGEEGAPLLSLNSVADYDSQSSLERALNEELRVLLQVKADGQNLDAEDIRRYLVDDAGILNKRLTGGMCESEAFSDFLDEPLQEKEIIVTETMLDRYLDFAENIICLF